MRCNLEVPRNNVSSLMNKLGFTNMNNDGTDDRLFLEDPRLFRCRSHAWMLRQIDCDESVFDCCTMFGDSITEADQSIESMYSLLQMRSWREEPSNVNTSRSTSQV